MIIVITIELLNYIFGEGMYKFAVVIYNVRYCMLLGIAEDNALLYLEGLKLFKQRNANGT